MGIWEKLQKLDRRIIFVVLAIVIIIPLIKPVSLPIEISEYARGYYNLIESLPSESKILIAFDFGPSTAPELYPAAIATFKHCFRKNMKVVVLTVWPDGASLTEKAFDDIKKDFPDKVYGVDYINLGYKPGEIAPIQGIAIDLPKTFSVDIKGKDVAQYPIMQGIKKASSFDAIVSLSAGIPGIVEYINIIQAQYNVKLVTAVTAVTAPQQASFFDSKQILGLLGGAKGVAEYELLLKAPGGAINLMSAQSFGHLAIVIFVIIANIAYFLSKRKKV